MTLQATQRRIDATLIPGDGIGPEIVEAVVAVLDAMGSPFAWDVQQGGLAAIQDGGDPLPPRTLDSIRRTRLALKGPLTTPVGGGFRSVNVRLREGFGLYANVRPARTIIPGQRDDTSTSFWFARTSRACMLSSSIISRLAMIPTPSPFRPGSTPRRARAKSSSSPLITPSGTAARR